MNRKRFFLILITLVIFSMMSVNIAAAEAPRGYFTATSEMIAVINPGTAKVNDHHVHVTGMQQVANTCWTYAAGGSVKCYEEVITINIVLSLIDLTGPMWGTFEFKDGGVVVWKGTFYGSRKVVGGNMVSTVNDVGRGVGPNEGLLFQYTLQALNIWDPSQPATFIGTGYVQWTGNFIP